MVEMTLDMDISFQNHLPPTYEVKTDESYNRCHEGSSSQIPSFKKVTEMKGFEIFFEKKNRSQKHTFFSKPTRFLKKSLHKALKSPSAPSS
jgi:hypothetical protein